MTNFADYRWKAYDNCEELFRDMVNVRATMQHQVMEFTSGAKHMKGDAISKPFLLVWVKSQEVFPFYHTAQDMYDRYCRGLRVM